MNSAATPEQYSRRSRLQPLSPKLPIACLGPGQTRAYGAGVIHSTAHPEKAWVIRVTGTDLDNLPRYRFGRHDKILEGV
jgi:hypothetical protein